MSVRIEAPWAKMPLHVINDTDLSLGDIRVYAALDYLCGKRGAWYGDARCIIAEAHMSRATVLRAIATLREKGLIETEKMGLKHGNVLRYLVLARTIEPPPAGITDDTCAGITDDTPSGRIRETGAVSHVRPAVTQTYTQTYNTEIPLSGDSDQSSLPLQKEPSESRSTKTRTRHDLTPEQRERIIADFSDVADVAEEIDRALQHNAARKNTDMNLYVRGWLRRARGFSQTGGQRGRAGRPSAPASGSADAPFGDVLADLERRGFVYGAGRGLAS